jgi:hypothetical protein
MSQVPIAFASTSVATICGEVHAAKRYNVCSATLCMVRS